MFGRMFCLFPPVPKQILAWFLVASLHIGSAQHYYENPIVADGADPAVVVEDGIWHLFVTHKYSTYH